MAADLYLKLYHGRDTVEEEMDDWGFEGPTLGPFRSIVITYMGTIKISMERKAFKAAFPEVFAEWEAKGYSNAAGDYDPTDGRSWVDEILFPIEDLIEFQGKFYGDFAITAEPAPET